MKLVPTHNQQQCFYLKVVSYRTAELLIFMCYILLLSPSPVCCIEESMCIGVGYTKNNERESDGLISMGASNFFLNPVNTIWAAYHSSLQPSTSAVNAQGVPVVKLYYLKVNATDRSEEIANGWFQLTVLRGTAQPIYALAVWAITEQRDTFGQFVQFGPRICLNWLTSENCVPCSATPVNSPVNPNMFLFTTNQPITSFVNLYWKADTTACNKPEKINFIVVINPAEWHPLNKIGPFHPNSGKTNRLGPLVYQSTDIILRFYGPASPIFDIYPLTDECMFRGIYLATDKNANWFEKPMPTVSGVLTNLGPEWYADRDMTSPSSSADSEAAVKRQVCKARSQGFVDFGGRCERKVAGSLQRVYADDNNPPQCDFVRTKFHQDDLKRLKGHLQDFVEVSSTQLVTKGKSCPPVPDASTVASIAARTYINWIEPTPYNSDELGCQHNFSVKEYHLLGLCKHSAAGTKVTIIRTWHAATLLFCTMVLTPVTTFMARYLKGHLPPTGHLHDAHQLPVRTWYIAHIIIVLPTACVFLTGLASIERQTELLGYSLSPFSTFHRVAGFVLMGLYVFEGLSGFLRPINIPLRRGVIFLHWLCGYGIYYGNVAISILTYRIPASPLTFKNHLTPEFRDPLKHYGVVFLISWFFVDLAFNICLSVTIHMIRFARKHFGKTNMLCVYFPVFLPMYVDSTGHHTHNSDSKENKFLWRLFYVYFTICILSYLFLLLLIGQLNTEPIQGFGPMQCTHDRKGKFAAGGPQANRHC